MKILIKNLFTFKKMNGFRYWINLLLVKTGYIRRNVLEPISVIARSEEVKVSLKNAKSVVRKI